jgi:IS5 family transposase
MQQSDLGLNLSTKKTRKHKFLEQMQQLVPLKDLVALITPCAPERRKGSPTLPVEMLLRIHLLGRWLCVDQYRLSDSRK